MKRRICPNYVGVTCIDGSCPRANIEKYIEYDIPYPKNCKECGYYYGCEDCYFYDNEEFPCSDEMIKRYKI